MIKKLKILLIIGLTVLSLSGIVYITAFSHKDLKETILLNTLLVLILLFSYMVIYRNSKEISMAQAKVNYWKEKALLEDEARRSKNYLETILHNSSDIICLVKREGTIGYINPQAEHILGYSPEELRGKSLLEIVSAHQKEFVMKKWNEMNRTYKRGTYETSFIKADGSSIPCLISYSYIQKYDEFLISLKDISEEKRLQEKVSSLHALNRKLITIQDVEQMAQAALETAQKILNYEFCDFLLYDEQTEELVIVDNLGDSPNIKGQRIPLSEDIHITKAFAYAQEALNRPHGELGQEYIPASFQEGSTLGIPVMTKEKVLGLLFLKSKEDSDLVNDAHMLLSELASQAAIAIENVALNKSILESEEKYRNVVDHIGIGIALIGPNMEILSLNNQMRDWFPNIDVEKRPLCYQSYYNPPREDLCPDCPIQKALKDGKIYESILKIPAGRAFRIYRIVATPLKGNQGEIMGVIEMVQDITEIKKKEDLIKKGKEEWERTFDTVPDLIALVDTEYRIKRLNKAMADRLKMSYQKVIGQKCYELIHRSLEPPSYCPHAQLMNDGKEHQSDIHSESLGGDFLVTASPLFGDKGHVIGSVHVAHDITMRKKAEKALKESEEKYRGVVEASLMGVFLIQDGIFRFVNNRLCQILGYPYEEMVGKLGLLDLIHPDDKSFAQKNVDALLRGVSKTAEVELKALKKDGETIATRILARTVNYLDKPALIGSLLDLSKEKTLELQLIRSQKMESLGQLAGGIAHDFNNILGIIAGSLDILRDSIFDEKLKQLADMAMSTVERGSDIVKRLLLFAREDDTELIPVSLPIIIDEAMKILEHTLEKNIVIRKEINSPSAVILGNKEQLLQMLLNIGVNARDAMPSGGILSIQLEKTDESHLKECFPEVKNKDYYALRIMDNGIGMNDRTKEQIFDPFFTTKERGKGSGLGLSIVHGIVSRHKGLIHVESSPGQGTTFSIYFPMAPLPAKQMRPATEKAEIKGGVEKILIVEDEAALRQLLMELLLPLGYEIHEAQDGLEAVKIFKEKAECIDLVILDIGLPQMSGDQVFQKMKEIDQGVSVIIASGYLELAKKSDLLKLGVKEFIQKPYALKDVALAVRRVLDHHRREKMDIPQMVG